MPILRRVHRHPGSQLEPIHGRPVPRFLDQPVVVQVHRRNHGVHNALRTDMAHQPTGIHAADAHQLVPLHKMVQRLVRLQVGVLRGELTHHEARHHGRDRLHIDIHGPVVPDVRVGHHHDLPVIGRIRHDLLIPRHAGVKTEFAARFARMANGVSLHDDPVRQGQFARRTIRRRLLHRSYLQSKS